MLLFETERAWAHSQDLRNKSNEEDEDPSLRKQGLARARRADQWLGDLVKLVDALGSHIDPQSKAETQAYGLSIKGSVAFDKDDWQKALELLAVGRQLLASLARCSSDSRDEALANSFVDASEAQMRFCAYQLGEEEQDMEVVTQKWASQSVRDRLCPQFDELVKQLQSTAGTKDIAAKEAVQIKWRDNVIPIRNPELVDAVLRAQHEESALAESIASAKDAATPDKSVKRKGKPQRMSHAERTARKRGTGATSSGGETSAAAASRALAKSQSTNDPYDHALAALTDGELVARRLVDDNAEALARSHSARYAAVGEDLKTAHEWLQYRLLSLQIKRSARLTEEVEIKAQKRETRKKEALNERLRLNAGRKPTASQEKSAKNAKAAKQPKPTKKPQPGSRAKQPRAVPRQSRRRAARSGTKRLRSAESEARASRARALAASQSRRRAARAIPAIAKLLDNAEANLVNISALGIIESDPDYSSVIDAKLAWYRADLLRQLARAHTLAEQRGEACLLLRRAALSIRQARQSYDLIDERSVADDVDRDIPPPLNENAFAKLEKLIDASLRATQKEDFFVTRGLSAYGVAGVAAKHSTGAAVLSLSHTKAGQQLRILAAKHADFDPVDVAEALQMDPAYENECEDELEEIRAGRHADIKHDSKHESTVVEESIPQPLAYRRQSEALSSSDDGEHFQETTEHDDSDEEHFAPAEDREDDDEVEPTDAAEQKKGWLGGWFGRK